MANSLTWCAIEQYLCAGRGEQDRHPFDPSSRESNVLQHLDHERPRNRFESPGNIHLDQEQRSFSHMKLFCGTLDDFEIVLNKLLFYKRTLVVEYHLTKLRRQPIG
jgi:hypothetical protein